MNPAMYQELTKKETTSSENMPAYHPLMKPSKVRKLQITHPNVSTLSLFSDQPPNLVPRAFH